MAALTVTAGEASANAIYLRVLVLTGATEAGGNSATGYGSAPEGSLTPAGDNSLPVWAVENFSDTTVPTAAADNTAVDAAAGLANGDAYAHGYYSGPVAAGTAVTAGCSASGTAQMAAYEVLASGAATPAQDASAPPLASARAVSVTTDSFTPPAGAVLVALAALNDSAGTPAVTVSDSSGLVWTQRALMNLFNQSIAAVFTATMPAPASSGGHTAPVIQQEVTMHALYIIVIPGEEEWDYWE